MRHLKKYVMLSAIFLAMRMAAYAQPVAINAVGAAPNASALLDLSGGVSNGSLGFLPPEVTLTATNAAGPIASPATGLLVYNVATAGSAPNNVIPGYYYWNGSAWVYLVDNAKTSVPMPSFDGQNLTTSQFYAPGYAASANIAAGLTSISYIYAYQGDNNFVVASNGHFSRAYGWMSSNVALSQATVSVYLYTPVTNSTANIAGVLLGTVTVNLTTAGKNYSWEIAATTALTKGQFIMVFYSPQTAIGATDHLYASGTLECTAIPQ